ncbi:hypothetical protein [Yoonia sp. MH D7]
MKRPNVKLLHYGPFPKRALVDGSGYEIALKEFPKNTSQLLLALRRMAHHDWDVMVLMSAPYLTTAAENEYLSKIHFGLGFQVLLERKSKGNDHVPNKFRQGREPT